MGIQLALAAMLLFGLSDLVYKRGAAAGVPAHQFLMVQTWCFAPTVLGYGLITRTLVFDAHSLWGVGAGLFAFAGFYNFARSLKDGSVSVNAPIFRLSFAITAALAMLLLSEPPTAPKLAGLALALLAVWLLVAVPEGEAGARRASRASIARVLAATAAVGVMNFLYKVGLRAGATPATLIVAQAAVVVVLATAFSARIDRGIRPPAAAWRHAAPAAVALASGFVLLLEGLARGEASVLVPVAQMGFVVTATLGFLLLAEPFTARKGAGLAAALAALASFACA
jgi:drug/metabolite transporter (DMT)-like permease